ncbi:MAG TPA: glucosaminidase domain-containing protein [Sediminibacterium sp.]
MKKLILFFCVLTAFTARAQKEKVTAYVNAYKDLAIEEMIRTGVPAAITLAQGILESQSGESALVKTSNNHFGIKCKTEWTGAKTYHDDDARGECFRVYNTSAESYRDHSDFLKTRPHYAFLFTLDPTDYEGWAYGLKKAGYATSPTYPQRLLKLINDHNLQQYTLAALSRRTTPAAEVKENITVAPAAEPVQIVTEKPASQQTLQAETAVEHTKPVTVTDNKTENTATPVAAVKAISYPTGIFTINNTKVMYAAEGTSLLSLANQFDIPLSKLLEFNDLPAMDILDANRLLFIERKPKRGAVDFHVVADGETLHSISQLEAIRLDSLLEYNHLARTAVVNTGDRIYLRPVTASSAPAPRTPK